MMEKGGQTDGVHMQNDWVPMMEDGVAIKYETGVILDFVTDYKT
jgi:hypothetical protein